MSFTCAVCNAFMDSYLPIVDVRRGLPFTAAQKHWQLIRRGTYCSYCSLSSSSCVMCCHGGSHIMSYHIMSYHIMASRSIRGVQLAIRPWGTLRTAGRSAGRVVAAVGGGEGRASSSHRGSPHQLSTTRRVGIQSRTRSGQRGSAIASRAPRSQGLVTQLAIRLLL